METKNRIAAAVAAGVALAATATTAQALPQINLSILGVRNPSATCLTAWDHIDGNGRPYGTRQTRCAGESFSHRVDWDMVCWPSTKELRLMLTSGKVVKDDTSDHCRKVATGGTYLVWTVAD